MFFMGAWSVGYAQVNISGSFTIHPDGKMAVFGATNFTDGNVNTFRNSPNSNIKFVDGVEHFDAKNTSHVDGYFEKIGNDAFKFPIGDDSLYRWDSISAPININAVYKSAFFREDPSLAILPTGAPFNRLLRSPHVYYVNDHEYWDLDGNESVQVTLSWAPNSRVDLLNVNTSKLIVVGWNGLRWENLGNIAVSGTSKDSGQITSAPFVPDNYLVITIGSLNTPPKITQSDLIINEDEPIVFCPSITGKDDSFDIITMTLCSAPANGTAILVDKDTCVRYSPNLNFNGDDSICLKVCDLQGLCDSIMVKIKVLPVNDTPFYQKLTFDVFEDSFLLIAVPFTDPENGPAPMASIIVCNPKFGVAVANNPMSVGFTSYFTYTPKPSYNGPDTVCIRICDGAGACSEYKVPIRVIPRPDIPDIIQNLVVVLEDDSVKFCPTIIDPDSFDIHTLTLCANGKNGVATIDSGNCIQYKPNLNYNGPDTICVTVCDSSGLCRSRLIAIKVIPVNDTPDILQGPVTLFEDDTIKVCPTITDVDINDVLNLDTCQGPAHGKMYFTGLCFVYKPFLHYNGPDTICLTVCDSAGACRSIRVPIDVIPRDDTPTIANTPYITAEDSFLTFCPTIFDADTKDTLTLKPCGQPFNGSLVDLGNGCFTYTPKKDYFGLDSTCMIVCDQKGLCSTRFMLITVMPRPDTPIATAENVNMYEDSFVIICPTIIDPDTGSRHKTKVFAGAYMGTVTYLNDTCFRYKPFKDTSGVDSLYIVVCDETNRCDTINLRINIIPMPDTIVIARNDTFQARQNVIMFDPVFYSYDPVKSDIILPKPANTGDYFVGQIDFNFGPKQGDIKAIAGNRFQYTRTTELYTGMDSFKYRVCFGTYCSDAIVYLNLTPLIPNMISPNGDGFNDELDIPYLYNYKYSQIKVFNRWGDMVWISRIPYVDDKFKGLGMDGTTIQDGTYYYSIEHNQSQVEDLNNFLEIVR